MVIYEVNLTVEPGQANEYAAWLREHIREMLALEGFDSAAWYVRDSEAASGSSPDERAPKGKREWTIHYHVKGRAALDRYFDEAAEQMRSAGTDRFEGQFSAERRVLESKQVFS